MREDGRLQAPPSHRHYARLCSKHTHSLTHPEDDFGLGRSSSNSMHQRRLNQAPHMIAYTKSLDCSETFPTLANKFSGSCHSSTLELLATRLSIFSLHTRRIPGLDCLLVGSIDRRQSFLRIPTGRVSETCKVDALSP